jgi:hypothetical protein
LTGQSSSVAVNVRRYGTHSLAIHLVGFALGFINIGLVYQHIGIESALAVLTPFADTLYGLGLLLVVAVSAVAGVPIKYLLVAGALIGIGLFYKSAPHEIHIASGIEFGLPHGNHIVVGTILITISVVSLAVLMFVYYNRSRLRAAEKARA